MVRLKHRYLVLQILYPGPSSNINSSSTTSNPILTTHRPSPHGLSPQILSRAIKDEVSYMYGDYGLGLIQSSLKVVYLSPMTSTGIIRVSRAHYEIVWAALTWMNQLPVGGTGSGLGAGRERGGSKNRSEEKVDCVMRIVRVCGTIRKAEEEVIRRAKEDILRARKVKGSDMLGTEVPSVGVFDEMEVEDDSLQEEEDMVEGELISRDEVAAAGRNGDTVFRAKIGSEPGAIHMDIGVG